MFESEAEILEIEQETHDVKTFVMKTIESIAFIPGQYCMISMPDNEELRDEVRPFTFSNSPLEDHIEVTVKKTGRFTGAMHRLQAGAKLHLKGPFGEKLNFDDSIRDDVVFVAGGSGITPFISAMRYAVSRNLPNRIVLLNGNKTADDIIYKEELHALNRRDNITVIHVLSKAAPEDWDGLRGRIDKNMVLGHVDRPSEKIWYICGPPPMTEDINGILLEMELPEEKIRMEDWQIPSKGSA